MKRFAVLILAGLLCCGFTGCSTQSNDVSEELAAFSSQLDAINQRLDQLEESAGTQEDLSSQLDSLAGRLDALESAAQEQPTPVPEEKPSSSAEEPSAAVSTNVEQVLFDEDGLKVTYTGIEDIRSGGVKFNFSIENNTNQECRVTSENCSVNGLMMGNMGSSFVETVLAGKKANTDIRVPGYVLEDNGIETIETLEFTLEILDQNYQTLYNEETVTITL